MTVLIPTRCEEVENNRKRSADLVIPVSDSGQYAGFRAELVDNPELWQFQVHLWDPAKDTRTVIETFANGKQQRVHYANGKVERTDI